MIKKKVLIVGFGSAGKRHASNAVLLGYQVVIVTFINQSKFPCYSSLEQAIIKEEPQYAIIASPTYRHVSELKICRSYNIPCLVEKPLSTTEVNLNLKDNDSPTDTRYFVAYLMRYHPLVKKLKLDLPSIGRLYDANLSSGQYLPWWRPDSDYRKCYSAFAEQGGGVLLDSSHEIDLINYLFGDVSALTAVSEYSRQPCPSKSCRRRRCGAARTRASS